MSTSVASPNLAATAVALLLLADLLPAFPLLARQPMSCPDSSGAATCRHRRHRP